MYCTSQVAQASGDQDIRKFMGMVINHRKFGKNTQLHPVYICGGGE